MSLKPTPNCKEPQGFAKVSVAPVQPKRYFSSGVGEDYTKAERPSHIAEMPYVGAWTRCSYLNLTCSLCKRLSHSFPELLCAGPAASREMGHLTNPTLAAGLLTLAEWAPGRFCRAISFR